MPASGSDVLVGVEESAAALLCVCRLIIGVEVPDGCSVIAH